MFSDICNAIKNSKNILILPHISADGDALGSSYALKLILEELGKNADVVLDPKDSDNRILKIIDGTGGVNEPFTPDLVIAVDCADKERIGSRAVAFDNCPETVCIDHHDTNDKYAKYNFVNPDAAATGEIIYELAQFMDIRLTTQIANNIYIAIVSDTGGFAYSNTKPHTHSIAAQLLELGVNNCFINSYLFEMNSKTKIALKRFAYDSFETYFDNRIAVVSVTASQISSVGATESDTGDFVTIPRSLEGVVVSMSFKETGEGTVKVSLRSQLVDVAKLAQQFGGGGHVRAAGCTVRGTIEEVKKKLVAEAERRIKLEVRLR